MRFLPLVVVFLLVAGCEAPDTAPETDDPFADETETTEVETTEVEWQAMLDGQPGFEDVSGTATANVDANRTHVTINVSGAPAGGTHPWHVHEGACGTGGGIVGDAGAYPALEVGEDGSASASAHVERGLTAGSAYHVNVHASPEDLATIVACGDLHHD